MADHDRSGPPGDAQSLGTAAARNLATTTKSPPQMQGITSRWLLRLLPWIQVSGGVFRVNRRLSYAIGDGRVTFTATGARVQVIPQELRELHILRGFDDVEVLGELARRFVQRELKAGEALVEAGHAADATCLVAHGKLERIGAAKYGGESVVDVLADGDHFTHLDVTDPEARWSFTARALTPCTVLTLSRGEFDEVVARAPSLRRHLEAFRARAGRPQDEAGEAAIEVAAGHRGEPALPGTFVDYELSPREYELQAAQTVLRIHTRVADLYNDPMNQTDEQIRLTVEALRERQEDEMINNREIGLLHNADLRQRIHTRSGPPSPDDLDELLSLVWKDPSFFLAHPRTIAAFARECNHRGIYPQSTDVSGHRVPAWRGVPIFPCNKIPVSESRTSSILLVRGGLEKQGVVGLHQTGIPDEYQPSLSVRFMGINDRALLSYLVTAYYSVAVLVPDALGILENVEIGRHSDGVRAP